LGSWAIYSLGEVGTRGELGGMGQWINMDEQEGDEWMNMGEV